MREFFVHRPYPRFRTVYGTPFPTMTAAELINFPGNVRKDSYRSWCESAGLYVLKKDRWSANPQPVGYPASDVRDRIQRLAFIDSDASASIGAHPANVFCRPERYVVCHAAAPTPAACLW